VPVLSQCRKGGGEFFSADFGVGLADGVKVGSENPRMSVERMQDCALRLIGHSASIQRVRDLISRVAPTDSTVLICGESGCGKDLVAESFHVMSPRADQPFVAINCAAIPATLIEAELFGHERGSFTGAVHSREGVSERASGGTLFLDEITEMPLDLQSRLLRVLETRRLSRVGGNDDLAVDVRVIASTNRSPATAFEEGRLREDIYYRLAVVTVQLPPLRAAVNGSQGTDGGISLPIGATLEEIERTFILATLRHFEGDKRRAADVLGCSLKTLYNKLHAYQRDRPSGSVN
jgi:DNA-binding NtrC family response regulator